MLKRVKRVPCIAVFLVLVLAGGGVSAGGGDEAQKILPRWKWQKGHRFQYHLNGDIVSTGEGVDRSIVTSVVTIVAKDGKLATFANTYTEIRWREKDAWYNATEEGLRQQSATFTIDTASRVSGDNEKHLKQRQEFLDALIGLPPQPVAVGSFWTMNLKEGGLHGTCEFTGFAQRPGRKKCAVFELELESRERVGKHPARELTATLYFDLEEGCFVRVERRIQARGARRRDERLIVEIISSPKHPSVARREEILIESLQRRLKRDPDNLSVIRKLSDAYARLGRIDDALNMVDKILEARPGDSEAWVRKGELLLAKGEAEYALEHFRRMAAKDKALAPRANLGAARAAFQLRRYVECVKYARDSLGKDGRHPYQAYYLLGAALAKLGKKEEARKCLERYVELNPGIDKTSKPMITFTGDNDVQLVVRRSTPGVDIEKRLKYTPEELAEGRELIKVLVKEESVRLRLTPEEIAKFLDYMAAAYGKKSSEMIADFLADREKTYEKLKEVLDAEVALPRERLRALAAADGVGPVTMEALLSMLEVSQALKRLEELVISHKEARYHYLLGRHYLNLPDRFGYINKKGKVVIGFCFDKADSFSEGLARVRVEGKWGYIDKTGDIVASPQFDSAGSFREGSARVRLGGKWGYVNKAGRTVIAPRFDGAGDFSEGLACVNAGGKYAYIDRTGKVVIKARFDDASGFSEGLAPVRVGGKWGYVDKSGKIAIEPRFDHAGGFSGGLAVVQIEGKKGYVNKGAELVIRAQFDNAWEFREGLARVEVGDRSGFIDETGGLVVKPLYDVAGHFCEGFAPVVSADRWSFIDSTGKRVIKPRFIDAAPFSEGLACVKVRFKRGYINREGKIAIRGRYDRAGPFCEGLAFVKIEGRQARMARKRFAIAAMYDEKSALYRYAKAFVSLKLHNQAGMLEELTKAVDLKWVETDHRRLAGERLKILTQLKYSRRVRKVTAWSLNDEAEAKMVKEVLDATIALAHRCREDGLYAADIGLPTHASQLYASGLALARHTINLADRLQMHASSALMFVTARSEKELALGVLVDLLTEVCAGKVKLPKEEYEKELPGLRKRLAELEDENLVYLRAYVNFLNRRERAFQVEHVTAPAKLQAFVNRLLRHGEVAVLKELAPFPIAPNSKKSHHGDTENTEKK